jgi:hypothetical protein
MKRSRNMIKMEQSNLMSLLSNPTSPARKKSRLNPIRGFVELRGVFEKMSTKINAADADVGFAIATTFF